MTDPPGGIDVAGINDSVAETPAIPATRNLLSMNNDTLLTCDANAMMPNGTHADGVVSADVETFTPVGLPWLGFGPILKLLNTIDVATEAPIATPLVWATM